MLPCIEVNAPFLYPSMKPCRILAVFQRYAIFTQPWVLKYFLCTAAATVVASCLVVRPNEEAQDKRESSPTSLPKPALPSNFSKPCELVEIRKSSCCYDACMQVQTCNSVRIVGCVAVMRRALVNRTEVLTMPIPCPCPLRHWSTTQAPVRTSVCSAGSCANHGGSTSWWRLPDPATVYM